MLLSSLTTYLFGARFSLRTLTKTAYYIILNVEVDMTIQLSSI